jgi:hypothetical protein
VGEWGALEPPGRPARVLDQRVGQHHLQAKFRTKAPNEVSELALGHDHPHPGVGEDRPQVHPPSLHIYDEIDHPNAGEIRAKLQPPGTPPEPSSA